MYQFTTTTIINSNLDSNGSTAKYSGAAAAFTVTRVGKFIKANILSVYKRPYSAGVKEVAKVTIPTITAGLVARLTVDVRLSEQTNSEYANAYLYFKKPVTVEVIATGTAATDATALVAQLNSLKDRFGFAYITAAVVNTADVQVTATDFNQRIYSMIIEKEKASTNSLIQPEYDNVSSTTFSVTTAGKIGFGDDDWMVRRIMLPTAENVRYFGTNKEERPVIGGNYTEYVLKYSVAKDHEDGIVGGGTSITTHVFYVLSSLQAAFETALQITFPAIVTIGASTVDFAIVGDQNVAASSGANNYSVIGETPGETVNWTNSVLTGTTSGNTTGILTVGATTGTTTLTATGATSGKVATLLITVV